MDRSSFVKSDEIEKQIQDMLGKCLSSTDLQLGVKRQVIDSPNLSYSLSLSLSLVWAGVPYLPRSLLLLLLGLTLILTPQTLRRREK